MPASKDGVQEELYATEPALAERLGCILLARSKVFPRRCLGVIADRNYAADMVLHMESTPYSHMVPTRSVHHQEDASINITAVELMLERFPDLDLLFVESGGEGGPAVITWLARDVLFVS